MADERNPSSGAGESLGDRLAGIISESGIKSGGEGSPKTATTTPSDTHWYAIHAGIELGPMSRAELREKVVTGEIHADDLVKMTGGLWAKASDLGFLQEQFRLDATITASPNPLRFPKAEDGATDVIPTDNGYWHRIYAAVTFFDQRQPMNKTAVAIAAIFAVACLIAYYIWSSHNRFNIITGPQNVAYEVDRKTGESWLLAGARKIPQQTEAEIRKKEQDLPGFEARKITGNASLKQQYGTFSGDLYNGSDWTVSKVVINVSAKEHDGKFRWSRDFSVPVEIKPLSTSSFSVIVHNCQGIGEAPWSMRTVSGHRE